MIETNDKKLKEWIQRDLAENLALVEFCDVDDAISSAPENQNILLPKFRIEGKTNKFKQKKRDQIISIPETKVQELKDMLNQIEFVKQEIEKDKKKINNLHGSNAQIHRDVLEAKQRLNQIKTEVEDTKLKHLKKLEEQRIELEKVKKEENRSKKARSAISQKRQSAEDELNSLRNEYSKLESEYSEFKRKRAREKKSLEAQIADARTQNTKLKEQLGQIEHELAKIT